MNLTIVFVLIGAQFCGFGLCFEHEIDVMSVDKDDKKTFVCIANIIGTDEVLMVNVNKNENLMVKLENEYKELFAYITVHEDEENGFAFVTAGVPVKAIPLYRIVIAWDETRKGSIPKTGRAITFSRKLDTEHGKSYKHHDYTTSEDGRVLLVSDVEKYEQGMSLMSDENDLIGMAFRHDQITGMTHFAKIINSTISNSKLDDPAGYFSSSSSDED